MNRFRNSTRLLGVAVGFLAVGSAVSHNTNTTHPRISEHALNLIQRADAEAHAYAELYTSELLANGNESVYPDGRKKPKYWGGNPRLNIADAKSDDDQGFPIFIDGKRTAIAGVVREDAPLLRVFGHFYHAYSGYPLLNLSWLAVTSRDKGFRYFDQSVEVYSDSDEVPAEFLNASGARPLGYWFFGHTLHHLQDMSSISHVHDDAHITVGVEERETDDYEASFLPAALWGAGPHSTAIVNQFQASESLPAAVVTSLNDIWSPRRAPNDGIDLGPDGSLITNSLARSVYNLAIFQASLSFPIRIPILPWFPACGAGELAEMFNDDAHPCEVHLDSYEISLLPTWEINEVGKYPVNFFNNRLPKPAQWWSVEEYRGPCAVADCDRSSNEYFYIEQLIEGAFIYPEDKAWDASVDATVLRPRGFRMDYTRPWHDEDNPVIPNPGYPRLDSVLDKLADELVSMAVRYTAGYAKYWFDIVNSPPYLKKLEVRQEGTVRYQGQWLAQFEESSVEIVEEGLVFETVPVPIGWARLDEGVVTFAYPARRNLQRIAPGFVNPRKKFQIVVEFSEPVRKPRDPDSGFVLRVGDTAIDLSNPAIKITSVPVRERAVQYPWEDQKIWQIEIPDGLLPEMSGRKSIGVRARDLNNHGVSGVGRELDADPTTPARRQRREPSFPRGNRDQTDWPYPWHDRNSIDVNFKKMKTGDFSYDSAADGDTSHIVLFDSRSPNAAVSAPIN